jgi:hypothetical protein
MQNSVRTVVSIPAPLFDMAETLAEALGISRSELYTRALFIYIDAHVQEDITRRLDEIYSAGDEAPDPVLAQLQWLSLAKEEW